MLKFKSISAKFFFIGLIMLAFIGVYLYADFAFTQHMKGGARKINLIGRERMLSIDIARHLFEIANIPSHQERDAVIEDAKGEIKIFEDILYGARDGRAWAYNIEPIHSGAEASQLKEIIELWENVYKPQVQMLMEKPDKNKALEYSSLIYSYMSKMDSLVNSIEEHHEREIKDFDAFRLYVFGFLLLFQLLQAVLR